MDRGNNKPAKTQKRIDQLLQEIKATNDGVKARDLTGELLKLARQTSETGFLKTSKPKKLNKRR